MFRQSLLSLSFVLIAASLQAQQQVVSLSAATYTFHENDGVGVVTVNRTGDPSVSSSVNWRAKVNDVFTNGTLTFAPNQMSRNLSLTIPNDDVYDSWSFGAQAYYVALDPTPGVTLGTLSSANIHLLEDEPPPVITVVSRAVPEGNSGTTDVHISVQLSGPFKRTAEFYASSGGGTASLGSDYEGGYIFDSPQFVTANIPSRQTSTDFVVRIHGDTSPEPDETIILYCWAEGLVGTGTLTLLNDDYILTPESQKLLRGSAGSGSISTSVPSPTTDRIQLSSSDPTIATVPPFIDIPAGSLGKSFDIAAVGNGSAVITAKMPPSRGNESATATVNVFTNTFFTFDQPAVTVAVGETTTVSAHFDPPPTAPVDLFLTQTNPSIASIPAFFTVGTNGTGTFPLRGSGAGVTVISTTAPAAYGGATTGFRADVNAAAGVAITRMDATGGPSTGGQRVTIYANGLSARCSVLFDGVSGLGTSITASGSLTTNTPPHDAGDVDVSVRCGNDTGTLPKAYAYYPQQTRLARISPVSGPVSGGVLITATGDVLPRGRCSLWFGDVPATTIQNDQATTLLVAAPPHAAGSVDVTMRCGSTVSTLAGGFLYASELLPQIGGVNPASGAPGERVIVSGSGFRDDDAIFFDGTAGLDVTPGSSEHFVAVPDAPAGNSTITLRDAAGHIVPGPSFRVLSHPAVQINSAPSKVSVSSEFQITGAGFRRGLSFLLGGTVLEPVVVESTYARLRLPASIGPGTYQLTVASQNVTPRTIQVADGVAVTSVSIPCSSTLGGEIVTIRGNGFAPGAVVSFGAADSSEVSVQDAHVLTAKVPPSSGLSNEVITVTNPAGDSGQLSNAFRYRFPDPGCGATRHRGAAH